MKISFRSRKLERLCNSDKEATKKLGPEGAVKLRQRLDELDAADTLDYMRYLPGRCEELSGDRKGQISLRLSGGYRLVFKPDHEPPPRKDDGGLDWSGVVDIEIVDVVDYHG